MQEDLSILQAILYVETHFKQEQSIPRRKESKENLDRFIPYCSAIDFDYAHYMLMEARKGKENPVASSPTKEAYKKQLAEALNMNRTRILAFKNKPLAPVEPLVAESSSCMQQSKPVKPPRTIPQTSERTLDAPEMVDDYYLNLLDWRGGVAAIFWQLLLETQYTCGMLQTHLPRNCNN